MCQGMRCTRHIFEGMRVVGFHMSMLQYISGHVHCHALLTASRGGFTRLETSAQAESMLELGLSLHTCRVQHHGCVLDSQGDWTSARLCRR